MASLKTKRYNIKGTHVEIPVTYDPIAIIGKGAYGLVISCKQKSDGSLVAVKRIAKPYSIKTTDMLRTLREIRLLRMFNHENVISIHDIFLTTDANNYNDVYIVTELMDLDLSQVIKQTRGTLSTDHCRYFFYQMSRALKYIHSADVIHRDLKPANLLVNSNCLLKICDLGLSRQMVNATEPEPMTEYVVTRWYRAPEIMLQTTRYTKAVDIWSLGCIFAELYLGQALFPGNHYVEQLDLIFEQLGTPNAKDLECLHSDTAKQYCLGLAPKPKKTWNIPNADPQAIELLDWMLQFDPSKRPTIEEVLMHPYLTQIGVEAETDNVCHENIDFSDIDNYHGDSPDRLRDLIYQEVVRFHSEKVAAGTPAPAMQACVQLQNENSAGMDAE
eukprot:TRINITY_DN2105_c0_g1_i1.p1 TRINITY_DN2105_c0_g1~~TRINITY_DN2105_c0_g1_i1.p1  ORF type:complete len:450 (+),score=73.31 TRINITY_DN2105_c0_g1_i1:191-1351(+)